MRTVEEIFNVDGLANDINSTIEELASNPVEYSTPEGYAVYSIGTVVSGASGRYQVVELMDILGVDYAEWLLEGADSPEEKQAVRDAVADGDYERLREMVMYNEWTVEWMMDALDNLSTMLTDEFSDLPNGVGVYVDFNEVDGAIDIFVSLTPEEFVDELSIDPQLDAFESNVVVFRYNSGRFSGSFEFEVQIPDDCESLECVESYAKSEFADVISNAWR